MQLKNYWQFGNINMNLSGEYVQLFTPVKQLGLKYQLWLGTNEIFLNYIVSIIYRVLWLFYK